jgi:glycosyltransferase A (GT-A) superfamily protein (DUF2064 family)
MTLKNQTTLVVFCKRPKINQGKQRLAKDLNAQSAFHIAHALLACAIEDARNWPGPVVIACSDKEDIAWAQTLYKYAYIVQQLPNSSNGNLGERLNYVDHHLRSLGHERLIFIGTDAPILNKTHFQSALAALNNNDIVLNHADDGGVIAMANSKPWPNLAHLPWSTDKLSHALNLLCQQENLTVEYALPGYDIDYLSDLKKLLIDLEHDIRPARHALIHTITTLLAQPKEHSPLCSVL